MGQFEGLVTPLARYANLKAKKARNCPRFGLCHGIVMSCNLENQGFFSYSQ